MKFGLAFIIAITSLSAIGQSVPTHLIFTNLPTVVPSGILPVFEVTAVDATNHSTFGIYTVTLSAKQISGTLSKISSSRGPADFTDIQINQTEVITASSSGLLSVSMTVTVPGAPAINTGVIPATFFGMHVLHPTVESAIIPFGTVRTWDVSGPSLDWADQNPSKGVYSFTGLDTYLAQFAGKDIIYDLARTPQWDSSQPNAPSEYGNGQCAPPADMANWDAYLTAITTHAAGRIKYWEIWNEPNDTNFYCGDIPTMATMSQHTNTIIKAIDPSAVILSPAPTGLTAATWLRAYFAAGGYADITAFHGYNDSTPEDVQAVITQVSATTSLPLWDTEANWAVTTLTPAQQAAFVARSYLIQWSGGVQRFIWYAYDGSPQWGGMWTATALSPAAQAYAEVQKWMVGAKMPTACSSTSSVWTCNLTRTNYSAEAIWGPSSTITVPPQFVDYRDLSGLVHLVLGHSVGISASPILLETSSLSN